MVKLIFLGLMVLTLNACQTTQKQYQPIDRAQWKVKALITDLKTNKKHVINLDINAIRDKSLRIDTTTPSGYHLSSLLLQGDNLRLLLMREKKLYLSNNSPRALKPIVSVPIEPRLLHNIIFDVPITKADWSCVKDSRGWVTKCQNTENELVLEWGSRGMNKKIVNIEHPSAKLQLHFYEFSDQLAQRKNLFALKKPKSFKTYRIK